MTAPMKEIGLVRGSAEMTAVPKRTAVWTAERMAVPMASMKEIGLV